MNTLDLVLLLVAIPAALGGWRLGLVARASSWLGMALGLVAAARFAPGLVERVDPKDSAIVLLVAATILVVGAFAGQLLGLLAGSRLRVAVPGAAGQKADRFLGAIAGVGGVLIATWLLLPILGKVREWPAAQVRTSFVAEAVGDILPEPPDTLSTLAALIGPDRWADIVDDFSRELADAPPPPSIMLEGTVDEAVLRGTVKVEGEACDELHEGSGFAVAGDLVVTNAHVVAGMDEPRIATEDGRSLPMRVVAFDESRDLAVLASTEGPLGLSPLPEGTAAAGDQGVVYGYPAGVLQKQAYSVFKVQTVRVADLYGSGMAEREIYFLSARLDQGDSGAPLVDAIGQVVGVAFATSENDQDLAFAISHRELAATLAEVRQRLENEPGHVEASTECLDAGERF